MAKRWTKKEVIELLDTMSLEELEILWREIEKVLGSDRRGTAADRSAWNFGGHQVESDDTGFRYRFRTCRQG